MCSFCALSVLCPDDLDVAAVQILMAQIEDNPLSDATTLMTQTVRAAMDCQGTSPIDLYIMNRLLNRMPPSSAFTSDQMSKLSDVLEAALPQSTSSPLSAHSQMTLDTPDTLYSESLAPASMPHAHSASFSSCTPAASGFMSGSGMVLQTRSVDRDVLMRHGAYGELAKEFGIEAHLVEALAQRLSGMR